MLKHIKQIYSDLTEFFLVLFTGVFVGSIFTLVYIKFWGKGNVTFADIGGMLAGIGTIGLLILAWGTTNNWKKVQSYTNKYKLLAEFYDQCFNTFNNLESWHKSREAFDNFKSPYNQDDSGNKENMKQLTNIMNITRDFMIQSFEKYLKSENQFKKNIIKLDTAFKRPDITKEILTLFHEYSSDQVESMPSHKLDKVKDRYHKIYNNLYNSIDTE